MKKRKLKLIGSIVLLMFGVLGIMSFVGLLIKGENMTRWILTLVLSVILVIKEIREIIIYKKVKKRLIFQYI